MKNIFKKLSLAMALMVCSALFLPVVAKIEVGATTTTSGYQAIVDYIKVENFKSTATVNKDYTVAPGVNTKGSVVTYTVTDPFGKDVTPASGDNNVFTPAHTGKYIVTYTTEGVSTNFEITVTADNQDYSIVFPVNSDKIVPSTINPTVKNKDGELANKIVFPTASLQDAEGNVLNGVITTKMSNNGEVAESAYDASTKTLTIPSDAADKTTYIVEYDYTVGGKVVAQNSFTVYSNKDYKTKDNTAMTYSIGYSKTIPTSGQVGVEQVLPSVVATDAKGNDVAVHYDIKITQGNKTYTRTSQDNVLIVNEDGEFVFTPNAKGDFHVAYTVVDFYGNAPTNSTTEFDIEDVKFATAPTAIATMPYDSTTTLDAKEAFINTWNDKNILLLPIYALDAQTEYGNKLTLERRVLSANGTSIFKEKDLVAEGTEYNNQFANKVLVFNADETTFKNEGVMKDATTVIKTLYVGTQAYNITIGDCEIVSWANATDKKYVLGDDEYSVNYIAKDAESGKAEKTTPFTMVVSSTFNTSTDVAPTVTFAKTSTIPAYMQKGESLTIDLPTATCVYDKAKNQTDANLTTFVTYQTSADKETWSDEISADADSSWLKYNADTKQYKLSIPEETGSVVYVKLIGNSWNTIPNKGTTEKIIEIYFSGEVAPTTVTYADLATDANLTDNTYVQGTKTVLPTLTYTDGKVNYLSVNAKVTYYDAESEKDIVYKVQNLSIERNANTLVASNAFFTPDKAGLYKVTFTSTNVSGDKTVVVFNLNIAVSEASLTASLVDVPSAINDGKVEIGKIISIAPIDVFVSDSEYLEANDWSFVITGDNSDYTSDNKTYIKFNAIGSYKVQFQCKVVYKKAIGTHAIGDEFTILKSSFISIIAEDTTGPVITNERDMDIAFFDLTKNGSLTKNTAYSLPIPESTEIVYEKSKVLVTSTKTSETITLNETGRARLNSISFTKDDTYTITYNLLDENGQITTKVFTLDVGDVTVPDIEVAGDILDAKIKVNSTIQIDLSKITITDKDHDAENPILYFDDQDNKYKIVKENNTQYIRLDISLTNTATGSSVENKVTYNPDDLKFEFTPTEAGDYKLVVKVTKLTTEVQKTNTDDNVLFTITADENKALTSEEVLGIVLIVVSVIVLAGVVTYFVVTRKKYRKKFN